MPSPSTANRLIVLTGATRGLGRAMAEGFAAAGHTVAGCGRDAAAVAKLRKRFGPPHRFDVVDVRDDAAVAAWAKDVLASHGTPDLLVNNAAVINRPTPLWKMPAAAFDAVVDTNVKGIANTIRHFVPPMVAARHGVIVNFSSGWGRSVDAEVAPYCATKWAVEGLTQALALELPDGMAAVPLNPGIIDTDMLRASFGSAAGTYPAPEEWAERAVPYILRLGARDNGKPRTVP